MSGRDQRPDAFYTEALSILEIDADNRGAAKVVFDPDDIDTAIEELDARYLAGEAAAHSHAWSVIMRACAAFNRHELPLATQDSVNIDHRRVVTIETIDLAASIRAGFENTPDVTIYIEAVHRLSDLGAVVTEVLKGTSQQGFVAEWRMVGTFILEGDLVSRCEAFDETDLDAALVRFDELQPQAPRLENTARRVYEHYKVCFAERDWAAMARILAGNIFTDDRRRVVNAGVLQGRDVVLADMRVLAEVGANITSAVIATRGEHLLLCRVRFWGQDQRPEEFIGESLSIIATDADDEITAGIVFDPDDIDTAIDELDARYLAGEAAPYARTWAAMTQVQAAYNRHEVPATTADCVNIDHRRGRAFAPGDVRPYISATYDLAPNVNGHLEAVHRLGNPGVVVTEIVTGTSQDGFAFEWREVALFTFEDGMVCRFELFDETDLDAALARFDELARPASRLDNAATRIWARVADAFNRRDVEGFLSLGAANLRYEDRRKGLRDDFEGSSAQRKAVLAMFEASPSSVQMTAEPIAIRGSRLSLNHVCYRDTEYDDRPITVEMMQIVEVSEAGLLDFSVSFDPDDIDAAFEELDARYLAGEAAAYSQTWTAMTQVQAAYNRHEIPPPTTDLVAVDHRRGRAIAPDDVVAYLHSTWDVVPDLKGRIEAVHRLSDFGAVITEVMTGTSQEGFDAEWREIGLFAFEGDLICRVEVFDEADLDAALARFDELARPPSP
jgi:ketosteroid isomerase-like protein